MRPSVWALAIVGAVAVLAGMLAYRLAVPAREEVPALAGFYLTAADPGADDLEFTDHTGKAVRLADYRGKALVLFFGFARCPDVCPTRLFELARVRERLGAAADQVQVVFVTLDPARDNPALLNSYLAAFDASFAGLTGTEAQIERLARRLFVVSRRVPVGDDYTIDHSAATYLIDPAGRRVFVGGIDTTDAQLVEALRQLVGEAR
jgi:protein SCO1/2